jgi:serine/threonine-protein kinase RsbW
MNGMRSQNREPDAQLTLSGKPSRSSVLEIDFWMPSEVRAISPFVDRLIRLIKRSRCVPGEEFDIELALHEALNNAVVHGNQENPKTKVHIHLRCRPSNEISITVTDQGKGFNFEKLVGNGSTSDPASEHGRGIQLMKAYMDDVHFERGGSEVHMHKRSRTMPRS